MQMMFCKTCRRNRHLKREALEMKGSTETVAIVFNTFTCNWGMKRAFITATMMSLL